MIAAIVALLGAAFVVLARARGLFGREGVRPRLIAAGLLWLVAAASMWLALQQAGFDPQRIGLWTFGLPQVGIGILFGVLGLVTFPLYILLTRKLGGQPPATDTIQVLTSASLPQRLFILLTAAGAEEIIFRAVAIGGLFAAGFPHAVALALPLAFFVLLHRSSWGWLHLGFVGAVGCLLTAAFWLGGLWAAVLAHFIIDAPMMLAGSAMADRQQKTLQAKAEGK